MNFARVEMLFLFWGVPLLLLAYLYGWRKRRLILERFAHRRALGLTHDVEGGALAGHKLHGEVITRGQLGATRKYVNQPRA